MILRCANINFESGFYKYYFLGVNDRPLSLTITDSRPNLYTQGKKYHFQSSLEISEIEKQVTEYANHVGS